MSRLPIFLRWGLAGGLAGSTLALAFAAHKDLSPGVVVMLIASAAVTFAVVALTTKVVLGRNVLVFHQHAIAIVIVSAGVLRLLGEPVVAYLDPAVLGLGAGLSLGRLGCLAVGCCHGRPARRGIRYSTGPVWLTGVPLVPVQAIESAAVAVLVGVLAVSAWPEGAAPGQAAASFVVAYAALRFVLEMLRGDAGRPHLWGVSHAQWTTALATLFVVVIEDRPPAWHVAVVAALAVGLTAIAVGWRVRPARRLLLPRHVQELGVVLDVLSAHMDEGIPVTTTSNGLVVSAGRDHYALSGVDERTGRRLAGLIVRLRHPGYLADVIPGDRGVLHVVPRLQQ